MILRPEQMDLLQEVINIGIGKSAGILNEMIDAHITLQVPHLRIFSKQELVQEMEDLTQRYFGAVKMGFHGSFKGIASLLFPRKSAAKLVNVMTGEYPMTNDLDSIRIGTLTEIGNIIINGIMGTISNLLKKPLKFFMPAYAEGSFCTMLLQDFTAASSTVLLAQTRFFVEEHLVEVDLFLFFDVGSFDDLLVCLDDMLQQENAQND
ncbi:MAG: CheY-P phosphatase CheC [Syntrophus sp. PtaB.Bin138]|nr:MAG: CheY-P phosphatase CheC [Syntrophus sp. PtaB.Bin138]